MLNVSMSKLGFVAIGLPLFGFLFAVFWSILYDFEASNRTSCRVYNFLPTVSSAIGGFTPQRYVWRLCIALQSGLRFILAFCYHSWHLRVNMGNNHNMYTMLVNVAVLCHLIENFALIVLSMVSSTENFSIHENSFVVFMVCATVYMLLSCILIYWTHISGFFPVTPEDRRKLRIKVFLLVFNISVFLVAVYLYFRHNTYCESKMYSYFAFFEYLTIVSNIAFHGMCCIDFKDYSFAYVATEEIRNGVLKNR